MLELWWHTTWAWFFFADLPVSPLNAVGWTSLVVWVARRGGDA
jgi:hypothetical protein